MQHQRRISENYIRFLHFLVIAGLIFPMNVQAKLVYDEDITPIQFQQAYPTIQAENVLYRPSDEVVEKLSQEYEAEQARLARLRIAQRKNYVSYWEKQCVTYAKELTGVWGTWGDGGRLLSANSDGQIGDVIVFNGHWVTNSVGKLVWMGHVGIITNRIGDLLFYTDRNSDLNGLIRYNVEIAVSDSRIWKFHKF